MMILRSYIYFPLFPLLATLSPLAATAQTQPEAGRSHLEIGISPSTIFSRPVGDQTSIRGSVPCSESYAAGSNVNLSMLGWGAWVFPAEEGETPLLRALRFSAGFDDISTGFISDPTVRVDAFDNITGNYTEVETEQHVDYALKYLRAALEAELALASDLHLRIGPNISIPLSGSVVEQEMIVSPANATFLDRRQERTIPEGTGSVDDLKMRLGVAASLSYRLPLGPHLFFEPQVGIDYGLTKIQPDWSPMLIRGGIDIGYSFGEPERPRPVEVAESSPVPPAPAEPRRPVPAPFSANVAVAVVNAKLPIEFRRQIVARYVPVLPVLFFEKNSSRLPTRYRTDIGASGFTESSVPADAVVAHREVLAIIGSRLREHPRATLMVTGTTSADEENRKGLAEARAAQVADLLSRLWGIERRRITTRGVTDPAVPSNSEYPEGREENRRVELEFSESGLYEPVKLRVVEPMTEPREIEFTASATASAPVERWELVLNSASGTGPIEHLEGTGAPLATVRWSLTQEDRERVLNAGGVNYRLTVRDAGGNAASSQPASLPVRVDTTVTVTSSASRPVNSAEFLLVTFEYDRAQLTRRGGEEMKEILARIGPRSTVTIVGYTDALGDAAHNRALAADRARAIAALLPAGTKVDARGASPDEAPYASDSPEGRFLSRTVRVTVNDPR